MINKRSNVFETNSSSVHTVTIDASNVNDLEVQSDGYVHVSLNYYGKEFESYNNSYDKLCYAILTVCYTKGIYLDWCDKYEELDEQAYEEEYNYWKDCLQDLLDTEEYKLIEECVVTEINRRNRICYGIKIHQSDCGIDHQSHEYCSLSEFLAENKLENLHDFIFGNYTLTTGCD